MGSTWGRTNLLPSDHLRQNPNMTTHINTPYDKLLEKSHVLRASPTPVPHGFGTSNPYFYRLVPHSPAQNLKIYVRTRVRVRTHARTRWRTRLRAHVLAFCAGLCGTESETPYTPMTYDATLVPKLCGTAVWDRTYTKPN